VTRTFSGKTLEEATEAAERYMQEWMQCQQPKIDGHYQKDDVYFVTVRYTSLD
jgi:O-succinylbenzoate synthase